MTDIVSITAGEVRMNDDIFDDNVETFQLEGEEVQTRRVEVVQNDGVIEIRDMVIESARNFKVSWVQLGQVLYSVWKDKLYHDWGYENFEVYVGKEVGLKKKTAVKLLRNYFYLEGEQPRFVQQDNLQSAEPVRVPSEDAVNVLRLAKARKELDGADYAKLKADAFENFKDAALLKKDLTSYIKQREELSPEEARRNERLKVVKRYLSTLKNLKKDAELLKLLPDEFIKDTQGLIDKLEKELGNDNEASES